MSVRRRFYSLCFNLIWHEYLLRANIRIWNKIILSHDMFDIFGFVLRIWLPFIRFFPPPGLSQRTFLGAQIQKRVQYSPGIHMHRNNTPSVSNTNSKHLTDVHGSESVSKGPKPKQKSSTVSWIPSENTRTHIQRNPTPLSPAVTEST